jgi:hypothetical protein
LQEYVTGRGGRIMSCLLDCSKYFLRIPQEELGAAVKRTGLDSRIWELVLDVKVVEGSHIREPLRQSTSMSIRGSSPGAA